MIKTPEEIVKEYENGLQGFTYDEEATNSFLSKLPIPLFSQVNTLYGDGKGKLSLPWKALEKFYPNFGADEAQQLGDCVSHAARNAVDLSRAYEILYNKDKEIFLARGATEPIYGCRGHGGEGMQGQQAAEFVSTKGGFLLRENYTDINLDLSKYSPSIGAKWGRSGVPKNVLDKASLHKIKTCSLVTSIEEARDLLANGYGISVCSNWGFSSKRDKFGISEASGSWNHAMAWIGVDDTKTRSNETLYCVQNSWGSDWISGPLVDQPPGSFWIRQRAAEAMIAQRQAFVFSDFDGYTRKQSWDKVRTIYS